MASGLARRPNAASNLTACSPSKQDSGLFYFYRARDAQSGRIRAFIPLENAKIETELPPGLAGAARRDWGERRGRGANSAHRECRAMSRHKTASARLSAPRPLPHLPLLSQAT